MTVEQLVGAKAFLSLDRAGTFICRKDGAECKFLVYQGAEFCEYDLLYERPCTEENGVIFEIDIRDHYEKHTFKNKAQNKLRYYDTVALIIDGSPTESTIYRQKDFQWCSTLESREMHLCLKDVVYTIDWERLGIPRINIPIALRFDLHEGIIVTPSRENVQYVESVKKIIKDKIAAVADWVVNRYNDTVKEFGSFAEAIPYLRNSTTELILEEIEIPVNSISNYSNIPIKPIAVKDINLLTPEKHWSRLNLLAFSNVGSIYYNNTFTTKRSPLDLKTAISWKERVVLLKHHPSLKLKEFLKKKYIGSTYFYIRKKLNLKEYSGVLRLNEFPKSKWRDLIKEYQSIEESIVKEILIDGTGFEESREFLDFVEARKAAWKSSKVKSAGAYKILDKQEGEITIAYSRDPLVGNIPVFEKNTYEIANLYKNKYITVIFTEEEKEEAKKYHNLHPSIKPAIVGKRERNKLPKIHSIMTEKELQKTKAFKKAVTSIRINEAIEKWTEIIKHNLPIVEDIVPKITDSLRTIQDYSKDNNSYMRFTDLFKESMLLTAKENNLWDLEILPDLKTVEEAVKSLYFLTYIKRSSYVTEEDKQNIKKIISQMLLVQKKYGNFEEYELVKKDRVAESMEKQYILEEEFKNSPQMEEEYA